MAVGFLLVVVVVVVVLGCCGTALGKDGNHVKWNEELEKLGTGENASCHPDDDNFIHFASHLNHLSREQLECVLWKVWGQHHLSAISIEIEIAKVMESSHNTNTNIPSQVALSPIHPHPHEHATVQLKQPLLFQHPVRPPFVTHAEFLRHVEHQKETHRSRLRGQRQHREFMNYSRDDHHPHDQFLFGTIQPSKPCHCVCV
jgi:hypothetical protein